MINQIVILSRNNTYSYLLNSKEYDMVIEKFNMHTKVVKKQDNVIVLKSTCYNSTYLKKVIERIVEEG